MPEHVITKCKSCGADIIFIKMNGKPHPVNAKPKKVFVNLNKGWAAACWVFDNGYESHFSSCPQAKQWRSKCKNTLA